MTAEKRLPRVLAMSRLAVLAVIALVVLAGILAPGSPPPQVRAAGPIGTGWQNYDLIVSPGDWDGAANGAPDIIARKASDGSLWLFSGDGLGGYTGRTQLPSGFNVYTQLVAAGNFTGNNRPDLLAVRYDGQLILFPNRGHGALGEPIAIASGWDGYDAVVGTTNFSGHNRPDVIVRNAGSMWISLGSPDHSLAPPQEMHGVGGWDEYSTIVGGGEWTPTHHQDLVARKSDGSLWLLYGEGATSFAGSFYMGSGWNDFS
jgi:hypothetical protein